MTHSLEVSRLLVVRQDSVSTGRGHPHLILLHMCVTCTGDIHTYSVHMYMDMHHPAMYIHVPTTEKYIKLM